MCLSKAILGGIFFYRCCKTHLLPNSKTAEILDWSEELLYNLHELLSALESTKKIKQELIENLLKKCFITLKKEFAEYSDITSSFHRALQLSKEFMSKYQNE